MHAIAGHEKDDWDATYTATNAEDAALLAKLAAQGLPQTIGNVLEEIAERMELDNGAIKNVLETDQVFEQGFDHLAGDFDASIDPSKPFSQWISILLTDQVVAATYEPTELLKP